MLAETWNRLRSSRPTAGMLSAQRSAGALAALLALVLSSGCASNAPCNGCSEECLSNCVGCPHPQCFGFYPTCWRPWPPECINCPVITPDMVLAEPHEGTFEPVPAPREQLEPLPDTLEPPDTPVPPETMAPPEAEDDLPEEAAEPPAGDDAAPGDEPEALDESDDNAGLEPPLPLEDGNDGYEVSGDAPLPDEAQEGFVQLPQPSESAHAGPPAVRTSKASRRSWERANHKISHRRR